MDDSDLSNEFRRCTPCNTCCQGWLKVEAKAAKAFLGSACQYCSASRCDIYESRPIDPCQNFVCAWLNPKSSLPDWMRPDRSHVIVMTDRLNWKDRPVITATYTVSPAPTQTRDWLYKYSDISDMPLVTIEFLTEQGNPASKKLLSTHGPREFALEMIERFENGEQLW